MNKRIISLLLISSTLLTSCADSDMQTQDTPKDVKNPFIVEYSGQENFTSVEDLTGEILYTPEYVLAYRFKGTDESEIKYDKRKLLKSKDSVMRQYGKSVMGTTYEFAQSIISDRGQDLSDYRITSEETLENLAQLVITDDIYLFKFCGVKLEDNEDDEVTVYYTMQQIVSR